MKTSKFIFFFVIIFLFVVTTFTIVSAGEPTQQLKQTIEEVTSILKNQELKSPEKIKERRGAIRKAVGARFDFQEMSQRSLAIHWKQRTPEERKEFVELYSDLLEKTYINKIEGYTDEKVEYTGESIEGDYAVVKTVIVTRRLEIPMEYRFLKKGDKWLVYDVVIEGVSLINNYRNQFNQIIRSGSYQDLVKRLQEKKEESL